MRTKPKSEIRNPHPGRFFFGFRPSGLRISERSDAAFTLIELILVMAILTMSISITVPTLSRFFRARTLDSEARRFVALTRNGQSRAVSEGLPVDLWVDPDLGKFGLEAEPSYDNEDPRKVDLTLDPGLQIRIETGAVSASTNANNPGQVKSVASVPKTMLVQPGLPTIRFLPDGSIADTSPQMLALVARDGSALWLKQSRNRLTYEVKSDPQE
jgi:prepilin-type N-terminal cleavage/methylation domain-containing protein